MSNSLPIRFGNWSGPGYAGGTTDLKPELFVELYNNVNALGYLDFCAKAHDAVYEYAERVYGKTPPTAEMRAMKNAVQFVADMDLVKNALRYQTAAGDFLGDTYRKMIVNGFYYVAMSNYGFADQMEKYWKKTCTRSTRISRNRRSGIPSSARYSTCPDCSAPYSAARGRSTGMPPARKRYRPRPS